MLDAGTAQSLSEIVAKGAMPPLVLVVDDCRAAHDRMHARGVEFTQEPVDRYGTVDAGFRDPSGSGWKFDRGAPLSTPQVRRRRLWHLRCSQSKVPIASARTHGQVGGGRRDHRSQSARASLRTSR
jgi:hypothetical protein